MVDGVLLRTMMWAPWLARWLRKPLARVVWIVAGSWRRSLLANAEVILGPGSTRSQRSRLGRSVLANSQMFMIDLVRLRNFTVEQLEQQVAAIHGRDRFVELLQSGRGAILVTAHIGSFETAIAVLTSYTKNIHVVYLHDYLGTFDRIRENVRRRLGVIDEPVDRGMETWLRLRDALDSGHVVLMQGDRVQEGQQGMETLFFGRKAMVPSGPLKLASMTGSCLVPVYCLRRADRKFELFLEEPIDVPVGRIDDPATAPAQRALIESMEKIIRKDPSQWLAVHKMWPEPNE